MMGKLIEWRYGNSVMLVILSTIGVLVLIILGFILILQHSVHRKYTDKDIVLADVEESLNLTHYHINERRIIPRLTVAVPLDLRVYAKLHGAETGHSRISIGQEDLYRYEMRAVRATNEIVIQIQICMNKAYAILIYPMDNGMDLADIQKNIIEITPNLIIK